MSLDMFQQCPVCGLPEDDGYSYGRVSEYLTYRVDCPRCGQFVASHEFYLFNQGGRDKHLISGLLREIYERYQEDGWLRNPPEVLMKNLESIFKNPAIPHDIDAQQRKILTYLKRKSKHLGDVITVDYKFDYPVAYAIGKSELIAHLESLVGKKYLIQHEEVQGLKLVQGAKGYSLSEKGFKEADRIIKNEKQIKLPIETDEEHIETILDGVPQSEELEDSNNDNEEEPMENGDVTPDEYAPGKSIKDLYQSMNLHPEVVRVSWRRFENGHYSDAILRAFIEVNDQAKKKANLRSSNDQAAMAKIFDEKQPLLQLVNDLQDPTQASEQIGFKYLFMGATTGIRNPKAHSNYEQKDPMKTLQYLAFASLLMNMIHQSTYRPNEAPKDLGDKPQE